MTPKILAVPCFGLFASLSFAQEAVTPPAEAAQITEPIAADSVPATELPEQSRAAILGGVSDGTPSPPAAKVPMPAFNPQGPSFETAEGDHRLTVRKVAPVALPSLPEPVQPAPITDPEILARISSMRKDHQIQSPVFISATVYDHQKSYVRWWFEGTVEYACWSNIDFNHLSGFASYRAAGADGKMREWALIMGLGNVDSDKFATARRKSGLAPQEDAPIPQLPPAGTPGFVLTEGDAGNSEAMAIIEGIHALYKEEGARLKLAWEGRERAAREKAEFDRLNPPIEEDVEVFYFRGR